MLLDAEVNLGPGHVVLDGVAAPPKMGTATRFSVHGYCVQTAGWFETPRGTVVDLGPGHIVWPGLLCPVRKGHSSPPLFGPCLLWPRLPFSATAELLCNYP